MTTNELLTEILQLMEMNFGERYTDYEKQVAKITFNGQHYEIFESDLPTFKELKDRLVEHDYLKEHAGHILASYLENKDNPYKIQSYKIFKEHKFIYLETYKGYNIFRASLNPHNSEYIIHELGFDTRWGSLNYCKKYIREQLSKKE